MCEWCTYFVQGEERERKKIVVVMIIIVDDVHVYIMFHFPYLFFYS